MERLEIDRVHFVGTSMATFVKSIREVRERCCTFTYRRIGSITRKHIDENARGLLVEAITMSYTFPPIVPPICSHHHRNQIYAFINIQFKVMPLITTCLDNIDQGVSAIDGVGGV